MLGGVGAVRPGRGRTPRRRAATCCRRSSPTPWHGHSAARRFRRASCPTDDAAPVVTELPILWLTADGDPQDPPANLTSIPSQQPNARIAVMPAQQHMVGYTGCGPQVIAEFVDAGTADGLDTSCIEQRRRTRPQVPASLIERSPPELCEGSGLFQLAQGPDPPMRSTVMWMT